jgi:hypothetical protein
LSRGEAEAGLRALVAEGVKRIKMSDECIGFSDQTGCPGHPHPRLDWVIAGGESGPKARPCAMEWLESLQAQCRRAGVPYFGKQMGAYVVSESRTMDDELRNLLKPRVQRQCSLGPRAGEYWAWRAGLTDKKGADVAQWPDHLVREFPTVAGWP